MLSKSIQLIWQSPRWFKHGGLFLVINSNKRFRVLPWNFRGF